MTTLRIGSQDTRCANNVISSLLVRENFGRENSALNAQTHYKPF